MTRVMVTSNENQTIAAGEELAQEISKIKTAAKSAKTPNNLLGIERKIA